MESLEFLAGVVVGIFLAFAVGFVLDTAEVFAKTERPVEVKEDKD